MLRILRQGQRWVLWFVIVVVGGVFVFYLGVGGATGGPRGQDTVVEVAGRRYSARDVDRVRRALEESYRQRLGDSFDREAVAPFLDESSARSLLRVGLLASEAERLGLQVTDPEIRDYLRSIPGAADPQGRIDREVVTQYAERNFGSVRRFQESLRDELLAGKTDRLLRESVEVSDGEALDALRIRKEEVEIAFVALDPSRLPSGLEITDDAVAELVASDPDRIRASYEARIDEFDLPERVRARHILIRVPGPATPEMKEGLRGNAEAILARIREGADFAEVAMEESRDPGTAAQGGDLGFFPRGRMVKPFEDVAFSLEPGEISDVVTTIHGFHIIKVEEKRPPEKTRFEEVQDDLARDLLAAEAAADYAQTTSARLATAVSEGQGLVDAAREAGVAIERPDPVLRRPDGRIPGLGVAPEVMDAAFAAEEGARLDRVFDVSGKRVMIEVLARHTPTAEELGPLVEETRRELTEERRAQIQEAWVAARTEALSASGDLRLDLTRLQ
jgi:peptidyl-prolyl cis-trans isomerase D